ncbi:MAG: hypothetical protein AABY64_00035 [Bdellovibrionota bacterium]
MFSKVSFGLGLCLIFFFAFQTNKFFRSQAEGQIEFSSQPPPVDIPHDLLQGTQNFLDFVSDSNLFTYTNCESSLSAVYNSIKVIDPEYFDKPTVKSNFKKIIRNLYLTRIALRNRLKEFVIAKQITPWSQPENSCVSQIRNINRAARYLEDYLGEVFLEVNPFDAAHDPVFFGTFTGDEPWLQKSPGVEQITIRSGDMIMSRGSAYTSAAIARIGNVDSQFSHMAFVYIEGDNTGRDYSLDEVTRNPKAYILEAHIEVGSTIRQIASYLKDGNARNVLFRYPDAKVAHAAAKFSYDKMRNYTNNAYEKFRLNPLNWFLPKEHPNFNLPYDFKMDTTNVKEVFCSEVVSMGFNSPQINLKVPMFETNLPSVNENDLVRALGIKASHTYAPGDTELEPRFEMLAEWRDYRKVRAVRYSDAILVSMFDWMKTYKYKFSPSFLLQMGINIVLEARWFDIPRIAVGDAVIFDVSKKLPKNMSAEVAGTVETLNRTAEILEKRLKKDEQEYRFNHSGWLMPYYDMLLSLSKYREQDYKASRGSGKSDFHKRFHGP